nr:hypothetical protein DA06_18920 [Georgenia sp. SUBG003]
MAGLGPHPIELVRRHAAQRGRGVVARHRDDDEVAQPFEDVLDEPPRIVAGLDDAVDHPEQARPVTGREGVHDVVQQRRVGVAQQRDRALVVQTGVLRAGDELVEHGQGVADRAAARPHHHREHPTTDLDALGGAQLLEVGQQLLRRHEPERVVVRARPDRADDLLRLRRREDEFDVGAGGSSTSLSRALKPCELTMWASSRMKIL